MRNQPTEDQLSRWQQRPVLAGIVRVVALVAPLAVGIAGGVVLGRILPAPRNTVQLLALLAGITATTMTIAWLVDKVARRLLPLAALLNLSLLFPDQAPSRYSVALRAGSVRQLERQIEDAKQLGIGDTEVEAAETVIRLSASLNAHDRQTRGHAERVRAYSNLLADELKLSPADRDRLHWAALLHDIGKLFVHPDILNKDGKPDAHEWEILKRHPEEGGKLVEPLRGWLGRWSAAIAEHHESYDGKGYPKGLQGEEISLGARVIAVADAYDVMTSKRSYKAPMSPSAARAELSRCAGKQFDPVVVRAFLNIGLGRLRWALGPLSIFELPLIGRLEGLVPQAGNALRAVIALGSFAGAGMMSAHAAPAEPVKPVAAPVVVAAPLPETAPPAPPTTDPPAEPAAEPAPAPTHATTPTTRTTEPTPVKPTVPTVDTPRTPDAPPPVPPSRNLSANGAQNQPLALDLVAALGGVDRVDPASIAVVDAAAHGAVTVDGGTGVLTYVPDAGYVGSDVVRYRACNWEGYCGEAQLAITIVLVEHAPVAAADAFSISEDAASTSLDVLANDDDLDGNLDLTSLAVSASPTLGTATVSGNRVHYTPAPDANGSDQFTYRLCDTTSRCTTADITMSIAPVNDFPSFTLLAQLSVVEDAGPVVTPGAVASISPGAANESSQSVTFTALEADPSLFSAAPAVAADGTLTFTPAADRFGTTTVTVTGTDSLGAAAAATFTIDITAVNDPPTFSPGADVIANVAGGAQAVPSWASAIAAGPGETEAVTFVVTAADPSLFASGPAVATDGTLTFTPSGVIGSTTVTVTARDAFGALSAPATFSLTLAPLHDHMLISEFRSSGPAGATDDFVELYNPTGAPVDISGWSVALSKNDGKLGNTAVIPAGTVVPYGRHFLLGGAAFTGAVDLALPGDLQDNGGVALFDGNGTLLDSVGSLTAPPQPGASFREGVGLVSMRLGFNQSYERAGGGNTGNCVDLDDNTLDFVHRAGSAVNAQSLGDPAVPCNAPPGVSTKATHLVISELRDDGPTGGYDEFVEIFNPTMAPVSLTGWSLSVQTPGNLEYYMFIFRDPALVLQPGQHLLLGAQGSGSGVSGGSSAYSGSVAPDAWYGPTASTLQTIGTPYFSTMDLPEGEVFLRDASIGRVDSVAFGNTAGAEGVPVISRSGGGVDSFERLPGGLAGSCRDSDDNWLDFVLRPTPDEQHLASAPTICP